MKTKIKTSKKALFDSPLGNAVLEGDENGISRFYLTEEKLSSDDQVSPHLADAIRQLKEYFSGERKEFSLKLNPEGTEFQKKVWKQLLHVPFGKTYSYLELSRELGDAKAIRAVAAANGKNPLWILIPCHRVIGSDGSLTGYAGGLWRKKWLLEHEKILKQQTLFEL